MNTSPHFRYYLAFVLLLMLGLAVRLQSVAGPESAGATKHTTVLAQLKESSPTPLHAE